MSTIRISPQLTNERNTDSHRNSLIKSHKSLLRIKKKSLGNIYQKIHKQQYLATIGESSPQPQIKQISLFKQEQEMNQKNLININFLRNIINRKKQSQSLSVNTEFQFSKPVAWHNTVRSVSKQYEYYDMIVRDLISEIKTKQAMKPTIPISQPIIQRQKREKRTATSYQKNIKHRINSQAVLRSTQIGFKQTQKRDSMVFRMHDFSADRIYEKKITSFIQFLYRVNFTNSIYVDLSLANKQKTYKVKIGRGNNKTLIKGLIKRRFWLQLDNQKPNFIWTQDTRQNFHNKQSAIGYRQLCSLNNNETLKLKRGKRIRYESQFCQKIISTRDFEECETVFSKSRGCSSPFTAIKPEIVTNHIPHNYIIGSKKALFMLMHWYYSNIEEKDPYIYLPKSYHIKNASQDENYKRFMEENKQKKQAVWLIKPGEHTNRGKGINIAATEDVYRYLKKQVHNNGEQLTYIVQQYINPFLYQGRKFDIRHFLLITSVNGYIKAYWYNEGYIRTSSQPFDLEDISNPFIHLTNDAIQKHSESYGKYEPGNKISYSHFQRYLDATHPHKKYNFQQQILNKIRLITEDVAKAAFSFLDPQRKSFNFQLYGMDFMIDNKFQPYLIEINANPCLQTSCPLLNRIIPTLTEHTLRIGLDTLFPPPQHYPPNKRYLLSDRILQNLKYQLIFDEKSDGQTIRQLIQTAPVKFKLGGSTQLLEADADIYEDQELDSPKEIQFDEEQFPLNHFKE